MQMALMTDVGLVHLMEMRWAQPMEMNWDQMTDNLKEMCLVELSTVMMVIVAWLGAADGLDDGDELGVLVGSVDGDADGTVDGCWLGANDGVELGAAYGYADGNKLGMPVGIHEGAEDLSSIDGSELFEVRVADSGEMGEFDPVAPAAIVLGFGCQVNSLFFCLNYRTSSGCGGVCICRTEGLATPITAARMFWDLCGRVEDDVVDGCAVFCLLEEFDP
eukprot:scaffold2523_cov193-Skeletonema_menzelii.AAC.4